MGAVAGAAGGDVRTVTVRPVRVRRKVRDVTVGDVILSGFGWRTRGTVVAVRVPGPGFLPHRWEVDVVTGGVRRTVPYWPGDDVMVEFLQSNMVKGR